MGEGGGVGEGGGEVEVAFDGAVAAGEDVVFHPVAPLFEFAGVEEVPVTDAAGGDVDFEGGVGGVEGVGAGVVPFDAEVVQGGFVYGEGVVPGASGGEVPRGEIGFGDDGAGLVVFAQGVFDLLDGGVFGFDFGAGGDGVGEGEGAVGEAEAAARPVFEGEGVGEFEGELVAVVPFSGEGVEGAGGEVRLEGFAVEGEAGVGAPRGEA